MSNAMNILLTGKNGQVGFELQRSLAPLGRIHSVDASDCDLSDEKATRELVRSIRPDVIINPAAYTAVDRAESEPALAEAVNVLAPAIFAEEAARIGACMVHYSTDYVFDGAKDSPYSEEDEPNPINVYGQTKLAGEQALRQSGAKCLILRTSWVVGAHGANFAKTMLRLAAERESLQVVSDQFGAPTSAALLADITALLVRQQQTEPDRFPYGLYHVTAGGETHWCDYARFVVQQALAAGRPLKVKPEDILPIATAEYPTPARRPRNSRLDTNRFRETFGLLLPDWRVGVAHLLQELFDD